MRMNIKHSLFGGALLAAGLAASTAHARSFSVSYSHSYAAVAQPGGGVVDWDAADGSGSQTVFASAGNSYARVEVRPRSFSNTAASHDANYTAGAFGVFSYFQVSEDVMAGVTWDFPDSGGHGLGLGLDTPGSAPFGSVKGSSWSDSLNGQGFPSSSLLIYDLDAGAPLLTADFTNPVGSTQVQLLAGTHYYLAGSTRALAGSDSSSSYTVMVPSPGTAGVSVALGLVWRRRRR